MRGAHTPLAPMAFVPRGDPGNTPKSAIRPGARSTISPDEPVTILAKR
jgi:hypothetical protein